MRFATFKDYGDSVRLANVVDTPDPLPAGLATPQAWLAVFYPVPGLVQVPTNAEAGAVVSGKNCYNHEDIVPKVNDGTYINPDLSVVGPL